jgi:type IV pilus assembly protein PilW
MNHRRVPIAGCHRSLERGFSMIELSVALLIALFLLTGMFSILQNTSMASKNQNLLAQLQDEERVAMTMITDVIQQAGYFPNAQTVAATTALPVSTAFLTAGQAVFGGTNLYGDTVTVRYQGDSTGSVLDCTGNSIPNGTVEEMMFFVQPGPNNNGALELYCQVLNESTNSVTQTPLVPNVKSLSVFYGVDANASGSANTYLPASGMTPPLPATPYWPAVYSVKITVTFPNPLAQAGEPGQTITTVSLSRVIGIMVRTGVNVLTLY